MAKEKKAAKKVSKKSSPKATKRAKSSSKAARQGSPKITGVLGSKKISDHTTSVTFRMDRPPAKREAGRGK